MDAATLGELYNEGPANRRDDPADADLSAGNSCLEYAGVPGVSGIVECELSDLMLSSMFPPLPELTVMCGGR